MLSRAHAAGFDGDVLDFGTPARRATVRLDQQPVGRWTRFEQPVSFFDDDTCGCLVLGLDDVALLRGVEFSNPRLRSLVRALGSGNAPARGIARVDGTVACVTNEIDARALLTALHGLLFDEVTKALAEARVEDVNPLAWRLWRASVSVEERALAIASMERSRYPEHVTLVLGRPTQLSREERAAFDGLLFHARQGLDWAVKLHRPRRAS